MAGAIIENLSTKKLIIFGFFILLFQILSVMVGAFIAPSPTSAISYLATKCINRHRTLGWLMPWGSKRCQHIHSFDDPLAKLLDANDIVFAVHVPLPHTEMSPWFHYMLAVLQFDIAFKMINPIEDDVIITFDAGLAHRDDLKSEWSTKFHSVEQRPLKCTFDVAKAYENEGRFYQCDPVPFMELGSVAHKYFLINLRLPVNDTVNVGIGDIKDVHVVGIHQNGGFTKVWISMKTVFTPWISVETIWYWRRISLMARPPILLENYNKFEECLESTLRYRMSAWYSNLSVQTKPELVRLLQTAVKVMGEDLKTSLQPIYEQADLRQAQNADNRVIFALGISMTFLNVPVEWLSLGFEWTWMLLYEDVQQGVFYSTLFCFWIIFCGEHLMDQSRRNRLSAYWWQLGLVVFGSSVLLIYDLSERGAHLTNPFYSVWASETGTRVAITFIIVVAISVCLYFLSLCGMVHCVFRNIGGKMQQLPAMPEAKRRHYKGIIFRFKFLMLLTLACAAMTVVFFLLNQVNDGHWHWGDFTLQAHSAFLTGVYGMWNLYVSTIMFLYAPSHKFIKQKPRRGRRPTDTLEKPESQETHLTCEDQGPTETYRITGKVAEE